jgi:hypothetical protein
MRNTVVTPMGASTVKRTWTFKLVDLAQVPREFLILDEKAVRETIRDAVARGGLTPGATSTDLIPGLEVFQDESLSVRT